MSEVETNTERMSVPQATADVLKLWHDHKLPDPTSIEVDQNDDLTARADLRFATRSALDAWNEVLGGGTPSSQPYKGGTLHNAYVTELSSCLGFRVAMSAVTPAEVHTELPDETLTALEQISGAR